MNGTELSRTEPDHSPTLFLLVTVDGKIVTGNGDDLDTFIRSSEGLMNISRYQGIDQFGKAYSIMLENDTHAPGSVDRVLAETMVRLCAETADYLYTEYSPTLVHYEKGSRPLLEQYLAEAGVPQGLRTGRVASIVDFYQSLVERAADDLDGMRFGGTEEEIIARGSDWCTDVARVACAMCQVAGVQSRLISLFNLRQAYSGHEIIEVFNEVVWGAVDPLNGVVYRHPNGRPATTWELMNDERLVRGSWEGRTSFYAYPRQFEGAAVCNYPIWRASDFDYTVSRLNDYTRRVLEMDNAGWPGGLRWMHGEEGE